MPHDIFEVTGQIENVVRNSIKDISSLDWDEDYITRTLLSQFRNMLPSIQLQGKDHRKDISWQAYKLKGTYENKFGDIALVVKIQFKDGTYLEGVAFLEAKKRDWRKTSFSAMKLPQISKILKHAPRAQYLLYDYEDITVFQYGEFFLDGLGTAFQRRQLPDALTLRTSAVCVPLNLAKATKIKDTIIYRYSTPLSSMLTNRYFQGLDLEFDDIAKMVATGFLKKFGLPKYVMEINVSEGDAGPVDDSLRVNTQEYEILD